MKKTIHIALIGNPNSGKSTLFNALVKGNQEVGNYPGVTVEKKTGFVSYKGWEFTFTDLPGIYNLTARSEDERIAKDYLLETPIDLILQVVDTTHLQRHLFLTSQLMEMGLPILMAANQWDLAEKRKIQIDKERLSQLLEIEILPTVASEKKGLEALLEMAILIKERKNLSQGICFSFSSSIEKELLNLQELISKELPLLQENRLRFFALRLFEEDPSIENKCSSFLLNEVKKRMEEFAKKEKQSFEMQISQIRHMEIKKIVDLCVQKESPLPPSKSDRIDQILLHRFFGLPIFFIAIYLTFQLTFTLGAYPSHWLQNLFQWLSDLASHISPRILSLLLTKGGIGGVGSVLIFLPNIFLLYLALSILESTGYMTRIVFLMDHIMHKIGLHGKSFLPMLLGFGCTVPAILATRTLESRRDRFITIIILPFVACSAKLTVFGLLIPPFFSLPWRPLILFSLYFIGILFAILLAKALRSSLRKEDHSPFLMELPPYRIPELSFLLKISSRKSWHYVKKAGSTILLFSLLFWLLSYFPKGPSLDEDFERIVQVKKTALLQIAQGKTLKNTSAFQLLSQKKKILSEIQEKNPASLTPVETFFEELSLLEQKKSQQLLKESYIGKIGAFIAPIFKPIGFDWRVSTSLLGAFASKEIFISQMGILFSGQEEIPLEQKLRSSYSPLVAFCIMLFMLISTPCIATLATTRKESSNRWAFFQLILFTAWAYLVCFIVYQGGLWISKLFSFH
jgi:ferrous iron transport protein B